MSKDQGLTNLQQLLDRIGEAPRDGDREAWSSTTWFDPAGYPAPSCGSAWLDGPGSIVNSKATVNPACLPGRRHEILSAVPG